MAVLVGLAPGVAGAAGLDLRGEVMTLAVDTTASRADQAVLGGRAALSAQLPNFGAHVRFGVKGGADADRTFLARAPLDGDARWTGADLGLGAAWTPFSQAMLQAEFSNWVRSDLTLAKPAWNPGSNTRSRAQETVARFAAALTPFAATPLSVQLSGEASRRIEETAEQETLARDADLTRSRSRLVAADLGWTPRSWLKLEGGWKAEAVDAARRASTSATAFTYVAPRLAGTATPWTGGTMRLSVEDAIPALNDELTTRLGQLSETVADGTTRLDKERRYRAAFDQSLGGGVQLSASLTAARIWSRRIGADAWSFDAGGERRQVEASLSAPLRLPVLSPLTLKARGAWRTSAVGDPIVGGLRRVSGEAPYDATLSIGGGDAHGVFRWEVAAHAVGPTTTYQVDQINDLSSAAGLDGSITYRPGPVSVRLELINIVGGTQSSRDVYYDSSRLTGSIDRIEAARGANRTLRIRLARAL